MKRDLFFVLLQLVLFVLFVLDISLFDFNMSLPIWLDWLWIVIGATGIVVIILGVIGLKDNITPFPTPRKDSQLISQGIYKRLRHPIYSGILIVLLGFSCYSASIYRLLITGLVALLFYYKSELEEKLLTDRFPEYKTYKRKTGRFFPKWK